ncbi:MaoC family dehydratase N-terminal domain-containing protein [Aestuariivirga sp.]|uniref:FAS1-like dehydratase domain-containing protein n=1 Tax=Aestuariivirga sp. TaxID=2650926 RepID=UPI0025C4447E|nr:MaoC family dehydratase N-terminal domain-containing protein [Aestuariivirga sp.]MCA3555984.1 MaoC family dehydratase N-terminal domain-containing protein [Aestuariivirga sp.]
MNFRNWIGRSVTRGDMLTRRLYDEFRATMGPCLFEAGEDIAPPGLHFGLAPVTPGAGETGPDGAELKGLFLPPIAQTRRMWAGGSIESFRPLRHGAAVVRTSAITGIQQKHGKSGAFCLVSVTHDIGDGGGPAIRERQDLVFRDPPRHAAPAPGPAEPLAADWQVDATPLLLFRFSAFTFNGHRIHYDRRHAEAEGYPNLVVHGPLQASLMLNLAAGRLGHVPRRFDYRCLAPLFAGARFGVAWDAGRLRVIRSDGVTTAEGQVHVRETG